MTFIIGDGKGAGYTAKVTSKNQLSVVSDSMPRAGRAAFDGTLHELSTGFIALTTTNAYSGIFYLINTSTYPCYIWRLGMSATVTAKWRIVKNPTAGTLISSGTAITSANLNFAYTTSLTGTSKKGANGQTITDGTDLRYALSGAYDAAPPLFDTPIVLGQSDAIAILCQPTASCDANVNASISQEALDL